MTGRHPNQITGTSFQFKLFIGTSKLVLSVNYNVLKFYARSSSN